MKSNWYGIAFWGAPAVLLIVVLVTRRWELLGGIFGYWVAFLNIEILWRSVRKGTDPQMEREKAQSKIGVGYLQRLGTITLLVVLVGIIAKSWLPSTVVGLATGMFLALILKYRQIDPAERGD